MSSLAPLDLLSISPDEQTILRCLTKHPQLTVFDLAARAQLPLAEVEALLGSLRQQSRIVEQLRGGQRVFSTRFQFRRRAVRNMPAELLNLYDRPADQLLAELPLTAVLPPEAADRLLAAGQKRTLLPDEVISWQGQAADEVCLLLQGLAAQTRLKGRRTGQKEGFLHRGSWVGLHETLSGAPIGSTVTAVTETTLLAWPAAAFCQFAQEQTEFAMAIARHVSQQLHACEQSHAQKRSKLWVVDGTHAGAGVTTIALHLAGLTQQQGDASAAGRVLFWPFRGADSLPVLPPGAARHKKVGLATVAAYPDFPDVLLRIDPSGYAPQVHLDMLLGDLFARYETIICDTGSASGGELLLRLRGQAHTLITLTQRETAVEECLARWSALQPYTFPGQKRVLALNAATHHTITALDARFQLIIPADAAALAAAAAQQQTLAHAAPDSPLTHTLHEVHRRLSLNHEVSLFVPSTMDVSQQVDNGQQVKEALSFLGNLFGGATSSSAEGAWRSEDDGLVTEQVTIVRTFVSRKALDTHLDDVIGFATHLKQTMKQEAVAISVDSQLILV